MQFPSALDLVLTALKRIKETSERTPRASRVCIEQLFAPGESTWHSKVEEFPHPAPLAPTSPSGRGEDARPISGKSKAEMLNAIGARVSVCIKCPHLVSSRTQTVFGVGNPD